MVAFYLLAPFPSVISRRYGDGTGNTNPCREIALFITAIIVVSAFGLPIILARAPEAAPVVLNSCEMLYYLVVLQIISVSSNINDVFLCFV